MGFPYKATSVSNICLRDKNEIVFNDTKKAPFSKASFPNLAQNFVYKLPPSTNAFTESKVVSCYDNIKFKELSFEFPETSEKY